MKTLQMQESNLAGKWIADGDEVREDEICERINWLVKSALKEISIDGDNWSALYQDPEDGRYWELSYPQSRMHGGGPPALNLMQSDEAKKQYDLK